MPKHYTLNLLLDAGAYVLDVNVAPDTDLDGTFKAWCNDEQEFIQINGWNVVVLS